MSNKYRDPVERIIANSVHCAIGCWIWIGRKKPNNSGRLYGYINVRIRGRHRSLLAHRYSLHLATNIPLSKIKIAMHRCDVPLCVNPDRLSAGSQKKNMRDRIAKGR